MVNVVKGHVATLQRYIILIHKIQTLHSWNIDAAGRLAWLHIGLRVSGVSIPGIQTDVTLPAESKSALIDTESALLCRKTLIDSGQSVGFSNVCLCAEFYPSHAC